MQLLFNFVGVYIYIYVIHWLVYITQNMLTVNIFSWCAGTVGSALGVFGRFDEKIYRHPPCGSTAFHNDSFAYSRCRRLSVLLLSDGELPQIYRSSY